MSRKGRYEIRASGNRPDSSGGESWLQLCDYGLTTGKSHICCKLGSQP